MRSFRKQKGFALPVSLMLLVVMTLMGAALVSMTSSDMSSNNDRDNSSQAFYAAESGISMAKDWLTKQNSYLPGSNPDGQLRFCKTSLFPTLRPGQAKALKNSSGQTVKFGSIGGGGRYDNLVSNFGNIDCPATGISIGLDRLVFALMQKKDFDIKAKRPVIICVFESIEIEEYINILNKLRDSKISSEIYSGVGKLKKQMEYANKIKSPAVILYGENENKSKKPTLRNLSSGEEQSIEIRNLVNEIKKII